VHAVACWQVDGYVFAIYNVGMMDHAVGVQQLRVSDGVYHVVRFTRDGPNSSLSVDDFDQYKRPTGKTPHRPSASMCIRCVLEKVLLYSENKAAYYRR